MLHHFYYNCSSGTSAHMCAQYSMHHSPVNMLSNLMVSIRLCSISCIIHTFLTQYFLNSFLTCKKEKLKSFVLDGILCTDGRLDIMCQKILVCRFS